MARRKSMEWLLDHPRELVRVFDDLTPAEVRRLIELRDRRSIAKAKEAIRARRDER